MSQRGRPYSRTGTGRASGPCRGRVGQLSLLLSLYPAHLNDLWHPQDAERSRKYTPSSPKLSSCTPQAYNRKKQSISWPLLQRRYSATPEAAVVPCLGPTAAKFPKTWTKRKKASSTPSWTLTPSLPIKGLSIASDIIVGPICFGWASTGRRRSIWSLAPRGRGRCIGRGEDVDVIVSKGCGLLVLRVASPWDFHPCSGVLCKCSVDQLESKPLLCKDYI